MKKNQIDIITMGCSKNLVDSELLMKQFEANGYHCVHDSKRPQGEIAVINTCGFIESAKEESINTILEFVARKKYGHLNKLFVMGCLSQRYKDELEKEIAEGCDRHCAYCAIPIITGSHKSRPMDEVLQEVRELVAQGVTEIQVIAQELTYYGVDIDGKRHIAELISRMADVTGVRWIRLHYAYPNDFPMELLDVIRERPNVCKYLDIALQHISNPVLKAMHRHVTKQETIDLITEIRRRVPGIALRTTLMVGFPGETEADFIELMDFVRWAKFERMGAFAYSEEEGTFAANHYEDNIPAETKQRRLDQLMAVQQEVSAEIEAAQVGRVLEVVIDRKEGDYYVGRTEYSSPEVDPEVLIPVSDGMLRVGTFYQVEITDSSEFDLYGKRVKKSKRATE